MRLERPTYCKMYMSKSQPSENILCASRSLLENVWASLPLQPCEAFLQADGWRSVVSLHLARRPKQLNVASVNPLTKHMQSSHELNVGPEKHTISDCCSNGTPGDGKIVDQGWISNPTRECGKCSTYSFQNVSYWLLQSLRCMHYMYQYIEVNMHSIQSNHSCAQYACTKSQIVIACQFHPNQSCTWSSKVVLWKVTAMLELPSIKTKYLNCPAKQTYSAQPMHMYHVKGGREGRVQMMTSYCRFFVPFDKWDT